jgi:hypothetical protein
MSGTKETISIRSQIKAQLTRPAKDAHDKFGNLSMQEKILDRIKYHTDFLIIDNFDKREADIT